MAKTIGRRNDITVAVYSDGTMAVAQGTGQYRLDEDASSKGLKVDDRESGLFYSQIGHRTAHKTAKGYRIAKPSEIYDRGSHGIPKFATRALHGGTICYVTKVE